MKTIITICLWFIACTISNAQIFGDNDVCAGNTYSYTAIIPGAASYQWTFPPGWYNLTGQGTSTASATCNINTGDIYCEGLDAGGNSITTLVYVTQFGGSASQGWDVQPNSVTYCNWQPGFPPSQNAFNLIPNGSSGSCNACGGVANPNIIYAIYDGNGNFVGYPNNTPVNMPYFGPFTWHVYQVDTTNGINIPQAIIILNGCGGNINNTITGNSMSANPQITMTPANPCIGDIVHFDCVGLTCGVFATAVSGCTNVGMSDVIVQSLNYQVHLYGADNSGCHFDFGVSFFNAISCAIAISGDTTVCAGYTYNYSTTIPGAVSYQWTFPSGWYGVTGQGTSNVTATCNVNDGNVCVTGYDAFGSIIGTECLLTQFGGGGSTGWDVQPQNSTSCVGNAFSLNIVPNGSGGGSCPNGCGTGIPVANTGYAVYDNVWPLGNFIGFADGSSSLAIPNWSGNFTYYVYYVDYTNGTSTSQAVRIEGGCGSATVNNVAQLNIVDPFGPGLIQTPYPACVGDTITLVEANTGFTNQSYSPITGITILSQVAGIMTGVVTNLTSQLNYTCNDLNGCFINMTIYINTTTCVTSVVGDTTVCAGYTYNYAATIPGAVTYQWSFPSGWYGVTGQGTSNVTATCNVNDGNVCVTGYDALGNIISTECVFTQFGGGGAAGWDVQPQSVSNCNGNPYALNIVPNGTGGGSCPNGCGNGMAIVNIAFAVYDNVWPSGNFVGFADGSSLSVPTVPGSYTFYIYSIDYTNGTSTSQAVRIEGGCGTASVNNIAQLYIPVPTSPIFNQMPDPVCIGDTVNIWASFSNGLYVPIMGITILNQIGGSMTAIVNSMPARAQYTGTDFNGCTSTETCYINVCAPTTLSGDTIVCAGYTYSYTANIAGAVTYNWLFPVGWYNINGQGTATVSATCNINDGWITVSGLDAGGNIIGVENLLTQFGGGGFTGWDVQPPFAQGCTGMPFSVSVVPNGTGGGGGCPPGCGNGTLHPNIAYAIYTNMWPNGNFLGYADGGTMFFGGFGGLAYVYLVDVTNGLNPPQAIQIEGGCGSGIVNNTIIINPLMPIPPNVMQSPSPACVGDTIQLTEVTGAQNPGWGFMNGSNDIQLLSSPYSNPLIAVVTGNNPYTDLTAIDFNGCPTGIPFVQVILGSCATIPVVQFASSDTVFCDKQSIDFTDLSTNNPTSWQWTFTGASPLSSTDQNPQGIYYPTSGSFDVTLIACNAAGCDTLTLANFIVEYQAPVDSIYQSNDTLFSFPAVTYQWFEVNAGLITGATNQYYVPLQNGNYYCIITDSSGCAGVSNTIAITTGIFSISGFQFPIYIVPNPNNGIFKLEFNSASAIRHLQIQIINVLGEIIFETKTEQVTGKYSKQINLSTAAKGIYYLKLSGDENKYAQKIILR